MKVSLLQENLQKGLNIASRFIATRGTITALEGILIVAKDNVLTLSASNLESAVRLTLQAKIEKSGQVVVAAASLAEFVALLKKDNVMLTAGNNELIVKGGEDSANFKTYEANDFPELPAVGGKPLFTTSQKKFAEIMELLLWATAADDTRPSLTGVLFVNQDKILNIVATDGYRLSWKKEAEDDFLARQELKIIIPSKTLSEVQKICLLSKGKDEAIKILDTKEGEQIIFETENMQIFSRLVAGEFPPFEKIVPTSFATAIILDKESAQKGVRAAAIFARDNANIIRLKVTNKKVTITAESQKSGRTEFEIPAEVEGEDLEIAFNYRYLLDYFSHALDPQVRLELNGSFSPGVFKSPKGKDHLYIVMPVRLQQQ